MSFASAAGLEETRQFSIEAQAVDVALVTFSRQANVQLITASADLRNLRTKGVAGGKSIQGALRELLAGTGLTFHIIGDNTIAIDSTGGSHAQRNGARAAGQSGEADAPSSTDRAGDDDKKEPIEKVTVTGSRIHGAKQASPVVTITEEDMRNQGATDLGQVVRNLPQNFGGGQNPGIGVGAGGINNQNISGSSSLNLRGLGQDATLTLLNGTRLPYDGFTQATDVAIVPIAAISRVEILLDGASAIYGSDAVGGVANIILKRDYDGAEFSTRLGVATQGGYEQQQYTGVGGTTWASGGFIVTADYSRNADVTANQRDFLSYLPDNTVIYSPSRQWGTLFSGHQSVGGFADFTIDAFYTKRDGSQLADFAAFAGYSVDLDRSAEIWGVAPALHVDLGGDWSAKLGGAVGRDNADVKQVGIAPGNVILFTSDVCYCNDARSVGLDFEGPLFELPGGAARVAFGGGYRENEFKSINNLTGVVSTSGEDSSKYVYGEVYLPVISEDQNIPLVRRLALSGAVRHEEYDSFGGTTTPKVGALWGVTADVDVKASWGKSFKVPTLLQQHQQMTLDLFEPAYLGSGGAPGSGDGALFIQGGNPSLTPERAETLTTGFVLHPEFLPGFNFEASWFHIDYTDRIVQPFNPLSVALSDPSGFEFVIFNPTVAQQNAAFALVGQPVGTFYQGTPPPPLGPYDPSRIVAIIDSRYVNSAAQTVKGVDLLATYTFDLFGGKFTANGNATWLETTQQLTALAADKTISGYVYFSPEFRGRIGGTWSDDGLILTGTLNYTAGVKNNIFPTNVMGDGMTTVDVVARYIFETSPLGGQAELNVGIQNLFDQDPPYLQPPYPVYVNYDSTNYSPLGRVVNVTLTQRY